MIITPASVDPETVWLRKEMGLRSGTRGADLSNVDTQTKRDSVANTRNRGRRRFGSLISMNTGVIGVMFHCMGVVWLLYAVGFQIPWYSVFPLAVMIAGGVFIVRAIIHDADKSKKDASSDRHYHTRN